MSASDDRTMLSRRSLVQRMVLAAGLVPAGGILAACAAPGAAPSAPTARRSAGTAGREADGAAQARGHPAAIRRRASAAATPLVQSTRNPEATLVRFYTNRRRQPPVLAGRNRRVPEEVPQDHRQIEHTPGQSTGTSSRFRTPAARRPTSSTAPPDGPRIATQGMLLDLSQPIKDDKINLEDINAATERPTCGAARSGASPP